MKYTFSALFLILFFLSSCNSKKEVTGIVIDRIQYDVSIINNDQVQDWWVNNLEGSKREEILRTLFEKAGSGDLQAYDYFLDELSPDEIRNVGIDTLYQTLTRDEPPYDEFDTMVIERITYRDVTKLRFLEEWIVDDKTMEPVKKVVGMAPIYERSYYEEVYTQVLFWVFFDKRYPALLRDQ